MSIHTIAGRVFQKKKNRTHWRLSLMCPYAQFFCFFFPVFVYCFMLCLEECVVLLASASVVVFLLFHLSTVTKYRKYSYFFAYLYFLLLRIARMSLWIRGPIVLLKGRYCPFCPAYSSQRCCVICEV